MKEMDRQYKFSDYIDRMIFTNGFVSNDHDTDMQFYAGYRIFVRNNLDQYESIDDWKEDTDGFHERNRYQGYGATTEYVYQQFPEGSSVIVDAGLRSWNIGLMYKGELESKTSEMMEKENLYEITGG